MSFKRSYTSEKSTPRKSKSSSPKAELASTAAPRTSRSASGRFAESPSGFSDFSSSEISTAFGAKAVADVMMPSAPAAPFGGVDAGFRNGDAFGFQKMDGGAFAGFGAFDSKPLPLSTAGAVKGKGFGAMDAAPQIQVIAKTSPATEEKSALDDLPPWTESMAPFSTLCTGESVTRVKATVRRLLVELAANGRVDYTPLKESTSDYARDRIEMEPEFVGACTEVFDGRVFCDMTDSAMAFGSSEFQVSIMVCDADGAETCYVETKRIKGDSMQHCWLFDEIRRALTTAKIDTFLLFDSTESGDAENRDVLPDDISTMAADLTRVTSPMMTDFSDSATTDEELGFDFAVDYDLDLGDLEMPTDLMMAPSSSAGALSETRMSDKDIEIFGDYLIEPKVQIGQWMELLLDDSEYHELRKNAATDLAAELMNDSTRALAIEVLLAEFDDSIDALLLKVSRVLAGACDAFIARAVLLAMNAIIGSLDSPTAVLQVDTLAQLRDCFTTVGAFWDSPSREIGEMRFYFQPSTQVGKQCDAALAALAAST
jgi:hypothetical protein